MIRELYLNNFKCFRSERIDLSPLTLLSGLNGMGKSSVIQSLLLLRQSGLVLPSFEKLVLNGDLLNVGTSADVLWDGAEKDQLAIGVKFSGGELLYVYSLSEEGDDFNLDSSQSKLSSVDDALFSGNFQYLRAERLGPQVFYSIPPRGLESDTSVGSLGQYASYSLSQNGNRKIHLENLAHPDSVSDQLRHHVEAWMGEISPGTRIYTESHSNLDLVSLEYAFSGAAGESRHFRSTNVGFGITYILPILVAVLSAKEGSLILLENPEAHLHPRGQVKMGELLGLAASAGVQLLVETHSDHLLNGVRIAVHNGLLSNDDISLYYFEKKENAGVTSTNPVKVDMDENGRIDYWPDGFFDETEKSLRKLLVPTKKK